MLGAPGARLGQYCAYQRIESLTELRNRRIGRGLLTAECGADFGEPPLDPIIDRHGVSQKRTDTGGDFRIQRARVGAGDLDAGQFVRATSGQMLAPQTRKIHSVPLAAIIIVFRGALLTTLGGELHCRDILRMRPDPAANLTDINLNPPRAGASPVLSR
jgi:hypothetical protein